MTPDSPASHHKRLARASALLFVLLGALVSSSRAPEDTVVARMELAAPPVESFVLHGTLPVPAGALDAAPGTTPLSIRSLGVGPKLVPAQVEVVSRAPDGTPDVVEVAARVSRPADTRPGTPLRFEVVRGEAPAASEPAPVGAVASLLAEPGRLVLRARDVFDNRYELDLAAEEGAPGFGSRRVLKSGPALRQVRFYGTLMPVEPRPREEEDAPLPHLLGVHAYLTLWDGEPYLSLDVRFNNGAVAGSRAPAVEELPLGITYWKELELVVPEAWVVVPKVRDPFFGPGRVEDERRVVPLVRANADGSLHMTGPQAQFHRRLIVTPRGTRQRARQHHEGVGLAFCVRGDGHWSWFADETAHYFPQRHVLASLDFWRRGKSLGKANVRSEDWRAARELEGVLESGRGGRGYAQADVMGWAHPWFVRIEGGAGGEGIAMFEGHRAAGAASVGDYVRLELLHRMNASRQPEAAYDRRGDPVGFHAWLDEEGRIPFDFRTNAHIVPPPLRLPMRGGPPASAQVRAVVERGLRPAYDRGTPYEADGDYPGDERVLLAWSPHDGQHMIRYTKNAKALVWLGNDSLAKDDLLLSAELFHLMFHEAPHVPARWSEGITLRVLEGVAAAHPHTGIHVNRDHAWGIDSMCAAYSVAPPAWRARNRAWFSRVAALFELAAMPNGIVQRNEVNAKILGHTRYAAAQGFEVLFLVHAMRCMVESVLRDVAPDEARALEELAVRTVDHLFWGPVFQRFQTPWQPDPEHPTRFVHGPLAAIPVALNDGRETPPFSDADHWGPDYLPTDFVFKHVDTTYVWQALSFAHEVTDGPENSGGAGSGLENRYLRRALDCAAGYGSYSELLRAFQAQTAEGSTEDSKNWVGLLGKLQNLGVR